jgi:hypothetical protein
VPTTHANPNDQEANGNTGLILISAVLLIACFTFAPHSTSYAQDSTLVQTPAIKAHSIKRAAIYSAVLPGLGQIYNRKAWKIPIIYAGFGVLGYFIYTNNQEYKIYKEAYIYVSNGETYPIDNPYVSRYNQDQLRRGLDYYRRNRDLSIIITSLWYVLNILEAYVDAHFFDYDVSEDLSLHVAPSAESLFARRTDIAPGLKLTLKF